MMTDLSGAPDPVRSLRRSSVKASRPPLLPSRPSWPSASVWGRVRDPQGHSCWIHEHVEDVDAADLAARFADPSAQQALVYVQESLKSKLSGVR